MKILVTYPHPRYVYITPIPDQWWWEYDDGTMTSDRVEESQTNNGRKVKDRSDRTSWKGKVKRIRMPRGWRCSTEQGHRLERKQSRGEWTQRQIEDSVPYIESRRSTKGQELELDMSWSRQMSWFRRKTIRTSRSNRLRQVDPNS